MNAVGVAQAHAACAALKHRGIASIVASPLSRARDTADVVAAALGLPVALDDGLREVSFGVQEGQPMSDWFAEWVYGRATPEGAESFAVLTERHRRQPGAGQSGAGAGGGAWGAVPCPAWGDGVGAEHPHSQCHTIFLRTRRALDLDARDFNAWD